MGKVGRPVGYKMSTESKRQISESKKGHVHKESSKKKTSESLKKYFKHNKHHCNKNIGSKRVSGGYWQIKTTSGWKMEHRYKVECFIGRTLGTHEVVHHKDMNPFNNSIWNLRIMTRSEHCLLHKKINRGQKC